MTKNEALQLYIDISERIKKEHTADEIVQYLCYMLRILADIKEE